MKVLWCWRCKMEIPMLDEAEFETLMDVHQKAREGEEVDNPKFPDQSSRRTGPILEKYKEMIGFEETNHLAIFHHRISIYGGPCANCGKPLRTPKAAFCAACGRPK